MKKTILQKLTFNEYINSKFPEEVAGKEYAYLIPKKHKNFPPNTEVYILEEDPNNGGYGLAYSVWFKYIADGISWFKQISYSSSVLSNMGLRIVRCPMFGDKEIVDALIEGGHYTKTEAYTVTFGDTYYDNTPSNRKVMRAWSDHTTFC